MSALCVHCEQPEQRHAHGMCPIVAYGELQGWHPVNRFTTRDVMSIDLKRHRDSSAIPHHVGESPATVQPASQPEDEIPCRHCAKLPNDHHCGDARFCELRPSERLSYEPQPANAAAGDSLIAAIEGNYAGMSHADLVLTCRMLERGRAAWRKEAEEAQARLSSPCCLFAGPGRGDCEHFVGLPGELVDGHNTDTYGKPNGWCWYCWWSYRTHKAEKRCAELEEAIRKHRDQKGDDRCWLDDEELYRSLPEGFTPPQRDTAVELELCHKFIQCRHNPATKYESPQRRIEALENALRDLLSSRYSGDPGAVAEATERAGAMLSGGKEAK